jgi:hypothetical protein
VHVRLPLALEAGVTQNPGRWDQSFDSVKGRWWVCKIRSHTVQVPILA